MDPQVEPNSVSSWKRGIAIVVALLLLVVGLIGVVVRNKPTPADAPSVSASISAASVNAPVSEVVAPEPTPVVEAAPVTVSAPAPVADAITVPAVSTPFVPAPTAKVLINSTLWGIAKRQCGDGNRWKEIQDLNPWIDPLHLQLNEQLRLPDDCKSDTRSVPVNTSVATPEASKPKVVKPVASVAKPKASSAPSAAPTAHHDEPFMDEPGLVVAEQSEARTIFVPCTFASIQNNSHLLTKTSFNEWLVYCSKPGTAGNDQKAFARSQLTRLQDMIRQYAFKPGMSKVVREMRDAAKQLNPSAMEGISAFEADQRNTRASQLVAGADAAYHESLAKQPKWVKAIFPYAFPVSSRVTKEEEAIAGSE